MGTPTKNEPFPMKLYKEEDLSEIMGDERVNDLYSHIQWPKENPYLRRRWVAHVNLKTPSPIFSENENGDVIGSVTNKVLAEVVDTADKAIVDAIIREATVQGVNDIFLIDKEFIMSAIRHELIRRRTGKEENEK